MIVCVDAGNTNITYGVYNNDDLVATFRSETKEVTSKQKIYDDFLEGLKQYNLYKEDIEYAVISSVVPRLDPLFDYLFTKLEIFFKFIDYNSNIGINIKINNPSELGSDLLVGAYQAANKYGVPSIVVDMGTATTIFVVDETYSLIGGMIYPGLISSFNNLVKDTSKLVKTNIAIPESVIAKGTIECLQSGMFYGSSAMINGVIDMIKEERQDEHINVIMTGGIASFMHPYIKNCIYDENLLIEGLKDIYYKQIKKQFFF